MVKLNLGLYHLLAAVVITVSVFGLGYFIGTKRNGGSGVTKYTTIVHEQEDQIKRLERWLRFLAKIRETIMIGYLVFSSGGLAILAHHLHLEILDAKGWNFSIWELLKNQAMDLKYAMIVFLLSFIALRTMRSTITRISCFLQKRLSSHEDRIGSAIDRFIDYLGPDLSEAITAKLLEEGLKERQSTKDQINNLKSEVNTLKAEATTKNIKIEAYRHFEENLGSFVWCGDCISQLCREKEAPRTPQSLTNKAFTFKDDQIYSKSSTKSATQNLNLAVPDSNLDLSANSAFSQSGRQENACEKVGKSLSFLPVPIICKKNCVHRFIKAYSNLRLDLHKKLHKNPGTIESIKRSLFTLLKNPKLHSVS